MTKVKRPNHPYVVWGACFLWLTSMFAITWSLLLFLCVGDMLVLTGTDLVNAFVLLSGIVMLPTNLHMLYAISQNQKINYRTKVVCLPLWLCITWIILINLAGAVLCIQRIMNCKVVVDDQLLNSIRSYRIGPKHKRFMDNIQWTLKCCGMKSYKDWFTRDWYDKTRDYEWEPSSRKRRAESKTLAPMIDSVPLSCCKSGSCISNYLTELGTYSINTNGCSHLMYRIIIMSMCIHFIVFITVIVAEIMMLRYVIKKKDCASDTCRWSQDEEYNVRHIMDVRDNFRASSESYAQEDSDESHQSHKSHN